MMSAAPDPLQAQHSASAAARVRDAVERADQRLSVAIDDYFLNEPDRLDERTRAMLAQMLGGVIKGIACDIHGHAARLLRARREIGDSHALSAPGDVVARLTRAGLLRDRDLIDELIGRVRQDVLGDALPSVVNGQDQASLLVRLIDGPDRIVVRAAKALLAAIARRRAANANGAVAPSALPAALHRRLVWWIAAALRGDGYDGEADRALVDAAQRSLNAHDDGDRVEAAAMRLAAAFDPPRPDLPALLSEALGDRQPVLFAALLAHALSFEYNSVRALLIDPDGDRLWLALRAVECGRETLARVGLALSEADPRRDIEAFADSLDAMIAIDPDRARAALGTLALHHDFRAAIDSLLRSARS